MTLYEMALALTTHERDLILARVPAENATEISRPRHGDSLRRC